VEALDKTGLIQNISSALHDGSGRAQSLTAWGAGVFVAFAGNLVNNLPAGLVVASAAQTAQAPETVTKALLIGVDVGPNLSVTGSLATILWLSALRREGLVVSAGAFFKLGIVVMPPALLLALGAAMLTG
jgi:arsenical pump membrane protein